MCPSYLDALIMYIGPKILYDCLNILRKMRALSKLRLKRPRATSFTIQSSHLVDRGKATSCFVALVEQKVSKTTNLSRYLF